MFIKPFYTTSWLISVFSVLVASPAFGEQPLPKQQRAHSGEAKIEIQRLSEVKLPKTDADYLLRILRQGAIAQSPDNRTDVVTITDVKVNTTDKGLEVILVTTNSEKRELAIMHDYVVRILIIRYLN